MTIIEHRFGACTLIVENMSFLYFTLNIRRRLCSTESEFVLHLLKLKNFTEVLGVGKSLRYGS